MITPQPAIAPNPAGNGRNTADAARARASGDESNDAAANGLDFAALMAGFIADSPPKAAASADAGALEAQAAAAALVGREDQPASAGIGPAEPIAGAIALEYAFAPPAPAASRTDAAPQADAPIQGSSGAKSAGWRDPSITSSRTAADTPGARAPGEESRAAKLPGKPAAFAAEAPRPPASASPFDGSAPLAAPAAALPALSPPAAGEAQAARHLELQGLHLQLQPRASEHALASAAHAARLDAPLGSARWREDLAGHISVMLRDATTQAEIRVAPPELGPIQARVSVDNGVATVSLSAPAPATRDALEAALTTLRERLAESGIALGETSVSEDHPRRFEERAPLPDGRAARSGDPAERGDDPAGRGAERDAPGRIARLEGLVDLYA